MRCSGAWSLNMALSPPSSAFVSGNRTYIIHMSDTGVPQLQEGENKMSSLSRRACYKCGNVGHYAGTKTVLAYTRDMLIKDT